MNKRSGVMQSYYVYPFIKSLWKTNVIVNMNSKLGQFALWHSAWYKNELINVILDILQALLRQSPISTN